MHSWIRSRCCCIYKCICRKQEGRIDLHLNLIRGIDRLASLSMLMQICYIESIQILLALIEIHPLILIYSCGLDSPHISSPGAVKVTSSRAFFMFSNPIPHLKVYGICRNNHFPADQYPRTKLIMNLFE